MSNLTLLMAATLLLTCTAFLHAQEPAADPEAPDSVHDFTVTDIRGEEVNLADYRGKTLLIVNTASKCGFTPQYEGLQKLHEEYKDRGLVVIGFPSNDFKQQEPGSNEQILQFCQENYGVEFPMMSKIHVKGDEQHPLYRYLTKEETAGEYAGEIGWNFTKFLIGPDGRIAARFPSKVEPQDEQVTKAVEKTLGIAAPNTP